MGNICIRVAALDQLAIILKLQKQCYRSEAEMYQDDAMEPLTQKLVGAGGHCTGSNRLSNCLAAATIMDSVRGKVENRTDFFQKRMVMPCYQNRSIAMKRMEVIETTLGSVHRFKWFQAIEVPRTGRYISHSGIRF